MSHWQIVPLARGLHAQAKDWDRLNEEAFRGHPMLTSAFVDGLLQHFGTGREKLCQYVDNGLVQAMCIVTARNKLLWSSFLPSQGQIGATLIPHAAALATLFDSLPPTVMQFDLLCNDPDVGDVLAHAQADHRNHAFTMRVALDGGFDQYWASRPRHLQSNMRRYDKRLLADGIGQRYVHIAAPEQMRAAVERYAQLEGAGWKGAKGSALASSPAQLDFYLALMTASAASGHASVHELWLDDTLAASRLILTRGDTHVMLKTTYCEELASYAPGRLLLRAVIQNAFASQWRGNIEFCTDAPPDLLGWSTDGRWVQHASLYRSSLARKVILGIRVLRKRRVALRPPSARSALTTASFTHPDSLPADARKLMNRAERYHIEFGTAWYRNLVDTSYAGAPGICFYTLRRDDKILAVLPLRAEKVFLGWHLHSLCHPYTTLYEPAFERGLKATDLGFLLTAIQRDFGARASFKLAPMNPHSGSYQTLLDALKILGWHPFEYTGFADWYQAAVTNATRAADQRAALDGSVAELAERFHAAGGHLQLITEARDIGAAVAAVEQVWAASTHAKQPPQLVSAQLMSGLLRTYAEHGGLRLGLAWLGDTPVAAQVWIIGHGRAAIYPMVQDEAYAAYAPDILLSLMLKEHIAEVDEVSEVAYLGANAPYQNAWTSLGHERRGVTVHNASSLRGMVQIAHETSRRLLGSSRQQLSVRRRARGA